MEANLATLFLVALIAVSAPLISELPVGLRMPIVVVEIALGILVGPHVLGWAEPSGVLLFLGIGWLGFQIKPRPFSVQSRRHYRGTIDLPPDLPEPVRRHFLTIAGPHVPCVESVVVWGRGKIRRGLWLPIRTWVAHVPGYDFRRYMEVTWFGRPF
jgi:hypothetical protein